MGVYPGTADTSTKVDPTARPPTPWWNSAYTGKRNLTILNNMPGTTLPAGYPVPLHFDSDTTPTAAELYNTSQSSPKCNDLRIIYNDTTELDRVVQNCSSNAIDIWFRAQVSIPGGVSNSTAHQLYYGNASAGNPLSDPIQVFYPGKDSNTVGLWYFDEGTGGTVADLSGYNNNGLIGSGTWVDGKFGKALQFPGGNGLYGVYVPGSPSLNVQAFTIEAFVKNTQPGGCGWGGIATQGASNNAQERWHFQISNCQGHAGLWRNASSPDLRTDGWLLPDQQWHHVALAYNGSNTVHFYRDGALIKTYTIPDGTIVPGTLNTYIGSWWGSDAARFWGQVDQVRLSNIFRTSFPYGTFAAITNEPTTAAGDPIAPPVTGSPDLAVLGVTTYPNPGGGVLVQAIVQNQGDFSTRNGFFTDLYLDHLPTGAGDYTGSVRFWVNDPIAAGTTVTLATVITDLPGLGGMTLQSVGAAGERSGTLYAQADSMGAVSEPDNLNNI
jgi:hypothetical protein